MANDVNALKEAVIVIGHFVETLDQAFAPDSPKGKEVSFSEGLKIGGRAIPFVGVFKSAGEIWDEVQELNEEEKAELHEAFGKEFNLRNDEVEATIEEIFDWVISGISVVENWKSSKAT